jgi:hypothetical protein
MSMTSFGRWRRLAAPDRRLLLEALRELSLVRLALRARPMTAITREPAAESRGVDPARIAWAVRTAARVVPGAACLAQALAAQRMLASRGRVSSVEVGVARNRAGLEAHAWLVCEGRIVIGGEQAGAFVPLEAP